MSNISDILSDESFFGRGGDTEMRMVNGEMSHVNSEEATIIDMYGSQGEKLVEAMGSGTINPYTGKKEYFDPLTLMAIAAVSTAGVGMLKQGYEGKLSMNKAKIDKQIGQDTIEEVDASKILLEEDRDAQKELGFAGHEEEMGGLSATVGQQLNKVIGDMDIRRGKSNLVTSSIDDAADRARGILSKDFTRKSNTLWGNLQEKMSGIDRWFAGEEGKLDLQSKQAQAQIDIAKEQEKGTHIGEHRGWDFMGGKKSRWTWGSRPGWG